MRAMRLAAVMSALVFSAPALADDLDDFDIEDDLEMDSPDSPSDDIEVEDDLDLGLDDEEEAEEADLLDDEEISTKTLEGEDSPSDYREAREGMKGLDADDEIMEWEEYLGRFPNTNYRDEIERRMEKLENSLYTAEEDEAGGRSDAASDQVYLTNPTTIDPINPRTKAQLNVQLGFPGYTRVTADFEYAIFRNFSVHAGLWGRRSGFSFDPGVKWAFVKSARHQFVAALITDFRFNLSPFFFAARPAIGIGKVAGPASIQVNFGADFEVRKGTQPTLFGGAALSVKVAPVMAIFAEANFDLKYLGRQGGMFHQETVAFGLRFFPPIKSIDRQDPLQIDLSGQIPAGYDYWRDYYGAVNLGGAFFLD